MKYDIKLFAVAAQLVGSPQVTLELAAEADVAQLRRELAKQHPELEHVVVRCFFAVDSEYATEETRLSPEMEIACIPPVSGG